MAIKAGDAILASNFTGMLVLYGGATAPTGWLLCQGQSVGVLAYPELHAVIGYSFGGSGLNFNLPNLQDKFPIGKSGTKALGSTGGSNTKDLSHLHNVTGFTDAGNLQHTVQSGTGVTVSHVDHVHQFGENTDIVLSATQDVLNAYQALNYIIKT